MDAIDAIRTGKTGDYGILKITGYIERDAQTGLYVAVIPGTGAHTQAETLDEQAEACRCQNYGEVAASRNRRNKLSGTGS